jgi:hypothetical protein
VPFGVLAAGLRTRASSIEALAAAVQRDPHDVQAVVEDLARIGLVRFEGGVISYETPEQTLARSARAQLEELRASLEGPLQSLETFFAWLPTLMQHWDEQSAHAGMQLQVEVYRGPEAVRQVWPIDPRVQADTIDLVLQDMSHFFVPDQAKQAAWHSALLRAGTRIRALSTTVDMANPKAQRRIDSELAAGVQARMLPELPSWFWVMGGKTVAIPMTWGQATPDAVLVVHSPAIARILTWLFDEMWGRAAPVRAEANAQNWEPLLNLLLNGATVESAARALGVSARTGRRRLAEAMDHFGVDNIFALGAAWGAGRA